MITEIIGKRGCGKTLLAVKYAQDYLAAGKTVYANIPIKGCRTFSHWTQVPRDADLAIIEGIYQWLERRTSLDGTYYIPTLIKHFQGVDLIVMYQSSHQIPREFCEVINQTKRPSFDRSTNTIVIDGEHIDVKPLYDLYSEYVEL